MSLHNFNSNTKSWKMYTNTLTSISGDDLLVAPSYGKDIILEVSANNDIFFKKGRITKNFDSLISEASFNSLTSQVKYILQEISGSSALNLITSGISNDLLIKSYEGQDIILEVSGNSEIIFKRGDISYNLDDLIGGGGSQSSDYATYNILDITGKIIFTDNSNSSGTSGSSSNIVLTSVSGNIIPSINNTFKLGDVSKNWSNAYITDLSVSNINGQPYIASAKYLIDYSNSTFSPFGQDLSGETTINYFGGYVSLSEDGTIMGVTAPLNNGPGTQRGSSRIFKYNDTCWNQLGEDIDGEANNDLDFTLKLSKDGTIAAIGSFYNAGKGQVRIFKYNDISWIKQGQDIEGTGADDQFARSISLSANGKIIAIGATRNDTSYNNAGIVQVYSYIENDNSWNKIGEFTGSSVSNGNGLSVSLSYTGTILAISSWKDPAQVIIYNFNNNIWTPIGTPIYGNGYNSNNPNIWNFGNNIELSSDGTIIAIGERNNALNNNYGRVLTYKYNSIDNSWNKLGSDINGTAISYYDWNDPIISLSSDGTIMAVGFCSHDNNRGLVRLYKLINSEWIKVGPDLLGDNIGDLFGYSVSLSSNGSILAISAPAYGPSFTGRVKTYNVYYSYNSVLEYYQFTNVKANNIEVSGNIVPLLDLGSSLGSSLKRWSNAYISDLSVSNIDVTGAIKTYKYDEVYKPLGQTITNTTTNWMAGSYITTNYEGNIIAIGSTTSYQTGIIRIYKYNDISWVQISQNISPGYSISLNSSGNIIAIGNRKGTVSSSSIGLVQVYRYVNDNSWVQISQDILGLVYTEYFGYSTSINSAGTIVAIGSPYASTTNGANSGRVSVYKHITDGSWVPLGQTINGEGANDLAGWSVSLDTSGTILAIGAKNNVSTGLTRGQVRVYRFTNDVSWVLISQDIDGTTLNDEFGYSVSLNGNGTLVACGAIANASGHVKVYKNISDGSWIPQGQTISGEGINDWSGYSVSLNKQGNILAVGAPYNDGSANSAGHVKIYKYNGVSWIQIGTDIDGDAQFANLGSALALNGLGNRLVVGIPYLNSASSYSGLARVYQSSDLTQTATSNIVPLANNTYTLGSSSLYWSNAYIRDVSVTNIDVSGRLNVAGATKISNSLEISGNVTIGGPTLYVPASFTIDPIGYGDNTGTVLINGNLVVQGVTTTINSSVVDISDKMLVLASNASNSLQADGAGFEISGAKVNFLYNNSSATFRTSIGLTISGNVVPTSNSVGSLGESGKIWDIAYIRELNVTNFTNSIDGAKIASGTITTTQIANNTIINEDISANAAIAFSKINTANAIMNSDISNSAAIAFSKINTANAITNSDISNSAAIAFSKINASLAITDSHISASAAISGSKIANTSITSDKINQANNWTFSQLTSTTASIRDVSTTNIEVSGNILPLRDLSSNLGSSLKRWNSVFANDLSVNTINGQAYTGSSGSVVRNLKMFVSPPTSAEATLNVAVGNAAGRGFHGLFTDGRYAYLVPYQNPTAGQSGVLTRVDLNNWTDSGVSYLNVASGNALACGFSGGFTDGRYGYLVPYSNNTSTHGICTRIDLQNFTSGGVSYLDVAVGNANAKQFAAGFTDGTYAYLIPMANGIFTRINLQNFTAGGVSYLNLTTINSAYWGGFVYGNFGYLVPSSSGIFVRVNLIDWTIGSVSSLNVSVGNVLANGFRGGFTDGTYGYLAPYGPYGTGPHGIFTRVNLANFTNSGVSYLDVAANNSSAKGFWGAFTDGQYGYLVPYNNGGAGHGILTRVNLQTFSTSGVSYLNLALMNSTSTGLADGFTDGKYAYFSPYGSGFYNSTFTRVNISNIYNTYI